MAPNLTDRHGFLALPTDEAFTVTFGDRAENGYGMQMIGTPAANGLSVAHLAYIAKEIGAAATLIDLTRLLQGTGVTAPEAAVLVVKKGVSLILGDDHDVLSELRAMPKDATSLSYGRVVNKHARHNNCMGDFYQAPNIASGRGTVVDFMDYPDTDRLRKALARLMKAPTPLVGELNHYFDVKTCGIGWHGDAERKLVAGARFGSGANGLPLKLQWFYKNAPVGAEARIELNAGDIYFFSDKAVGYDFKRRSRVTLRHAAGKDTCTYARTKRKRGEAHPVTVFA
jgi:hypothetical protein